MTVRDWIEYKGTGFAVRLVGFPAYEDDGARLPDVGPQGLHRVIALELLSREGLLAGRELRFLRAHLDLSRSECARRLHITRRTLITWEEMGAKPLPTAALNHVSVKLILARLLAPELRLPDASLVSSRHVRKPLEIEFERFRRSLTVLGEAEPPWQVATYYLGSKVAEQAA
jgi:DNA-binding transcriptional regulator YiaG